MNNFETKIANLRGFMAGQGWETEQVDFVVGQLGTVHLVDRQVDEVAGMSLAERLEAYAQSVTELVANKDQQAALLGRHTILSAALLDNFNQAVIEAEFAHLTAGLGDLQEDKAA